MENVASEQQRDSSATDWAEGRSQPLHAFSIESAAERGSAPGGRWWGARQWVLMAAPYGPGWRLAWGRGEGLRLAARSFTTVAGYPARRLSLAVP